MHATFIRIWHKAYISINKEKHQSKMCLVGCNCCSFFIALVCSLFVQVVYIVLKTFHCDFGSTDVVGVLWFQTLIALFTTIYVCVPGLKFITKLLYLHLIPTFLLLILSSYVAVVFLNLDTDCNVYGNDMRPLLNAMFFAQGVVPVVSFLIFINDIRISCKRTPKHQKLSEFPKFRDNEED